MAGALPRNGGNKSAIRVGPTVSRRLRAADFNVSPSARRYKADALTVAARGYHISILVDLGLATKNSRVANEIRHELATWPQASQITSGTADDGVVFIWLTYVPTSR